ncbi:hypothetical protein PR003_g16569 [Phytophthora rubi]|uniref:RxLR effector protein n=1 Tax=Phytophthora rubi TaxID=129364 RepID=A0A6A3LER6_9STRA|nr:hypothetical protein PR002_g13497 [Phytophthora rubi]KAE9325126.1 hypothetical protein PR003_g16569 [Phytophthora rubi]
MLFMFVSLLLWILCFLRKLHQAKTNCTHNTIMDHFIIPFDNQLPIARLLRPSPKLTV